MAEAKKPAADIGFNMTPMIDCTFQLIIFFMLASQVANEAYGKGVRVPRPTASQAIPIRDYNVRNKVTINVMSKDPFEDNPDKLVRATAMGYRILADTFDVGEVERMTEKIKNIRDAGIKKGIVVPGDPAKEFYVEIRADKHVNWQDVAPAIRAAVEAGVLKMNITALTAQY